MFERLLSVYYLTIKLSNVIFYKDLIYLFKAVQLANRLLFIYKLCFGIFYANIYLF